MCRLFDAGYLIQEWKALSNTLQVGDYGLCSTIRGPECDASDMRRGYNIGQSQQRVIWIYGFFREDIDASPANASGLQGLNQGRLVNDLATGDVDNHRGFLHG